MSENTEAGQSGGLDTAKLVASIVLVVAGIAGYYWFSAQPDWQRYIYVVAGLVLGGFVAWQTAIGRNTVSFILSSRNEVRKMVWPTREETVQTTLAVIVVVLITGVLMWVLDLFLFWALRGLTGQGG